MMNQKFRRKVVNACVCQRGGENRKRKGKLDVGVQERGKREEKRGRKEKKRRGERREKRGKEG